MLGLASRSGALLGKVPCYDCTLGCCSVRQGLRRGTFHVGDVLVVLSGRGLYWRKCHVGIVLVVKYHVVVVLGVV